MKQLRKILLVLDPEALRRQGLDRLLANLSVAETRRHLVLGTHG
ncbi:MAG: hypothetical protein ABFR65_10545 [Pseudomonadota bacterium]